MFLSRVSRPVGLGSLLSWGKRGGNGLPVSVSLCGGEGWAGDHCVCPWMGYLPFFWVVGKWRGRWGAFTNTILWEDGC